MTYIHRQPAGQGLPCLQIVPGLVVCLFVSQTAVSRTDTVSDVPLFTGRNNRESSTLTTYNTLSQCEHYNYTTSHWFSYH